MLNKKIFYILNVAYFFQTCNYIMPLWTKTAAFIKTYRILAIHRGKQHFTKRNILAIFVTVILNLHDLDETLVYLTIKTYISCEIISTPEAGRT